jgi:hypothetical protein
MRPRIDSRHRREEGFLLVEVMVASLMGLMVVGAAVALFTSGVRSQSGITDHASGIEQARVTVERMVRELRQGYAVPGAGANQLVILTYVPSATCGGAHATTAIACRVTYNCTGTTCTRVESNTDGSSPGLAQQVVTGLSSPNIFSYAPSASAPTYVGVTLTLTPSPGQAPVSLDDGAALGRIGS